MIRRKHDSFQFKGDSGGGFYIQNLTEYSWNIRGIVSGSLVDFEHGCDINKFQLYTNVARFVGWILEVVQETKELAWDYVELNCSSYRDFEARLKKTQVKFHNSEFFSALSVDRGKLHVNREVYRRAPTIKSSQQITHHRLSLNLHLTKILKTCHTVSANLSRT